MPSFLWSYSPLDQSCYSSSDQWCRGFCPAAYQMKADHRLVTSSPFYKPHPFLNEGMGCYNDNLLNFPEIPHLVASLLHLLNLINIWLTSEPPQDNTSHYSSPYSKLCQTEAPSVQLPQCLCMNISWKLFCFLSGCDHLVEPVVCIYVCMCTQILIHRVWLYLT